MQPRIVEVRQGVLKKNDLLAHDLRAALPTAGDVRGQPGLQPRRGKDRVPAKRRSQRSTPRRRVAALVGDLATERDAERLGRSGAPVQPDRHRHRLPPRSRDGRARRSADWDLAALDFLFIENVGNLVCPASYDLGEDLRVVLLSVTEGEDKPLKYPTIFNGADLAILTKIDLAEAVGFDRDEALRNIHEVRPGLEVLETSARSGVGDGGVAGEAGGAGAAPEILRALHRLHRHPVAPAALGAAGRRRRPGRGRAGAVIVVAQLGDSEGAADGDLDVAVAMVEVGDAVAQLAARASAPSAVVSGARMTNSSPPTRASICSGRTSSRASEATCLRTKSPQRWP